MIKSTPEIFIIGYTFLDEKELNRYINTLGVEEFKTDTKSYGEKLIEFMGRLCYRSFKPGLNKNVTKIRKGNEEYIKNILKNGHESVLEHVTINFIFKNVSRVFCEELCRHRVGTAISQESLRYVRLDEGIPLYIPGEIENNDDALNIFNNVIKEIESAQEKLNNLYNIDNIDNFSIKKTLTSSFRRIAPLGISTTVGWSCNLRELRHIINLRTSPHAEVEMRIVFKKVFDLVKDIYPSVFSDFQIKTFPPYCCGEPMVEWCTNK